MKLTEQELNNGRKLAWECGCKGSHDYINEVIDDAANDTVLHVLQMLQEDTLTLRPEPLTWAELDDKDCEELVLAFKTGYNDGFMLGERRDLREGIDLAVKCIERIVQGVSGASSPDDAKRAVEGFRRLVQMNKDYPPYETYPAFDPTQKLSCEEAPRSVE